MSLTPRPGFALLELTLALAITVAVLLGARVLFEQSVQSAVRLDRAGQDRDRAMTENRSVEWLLLRFDTATVRVSGTNRQMSFRSRCDHPAGWLEPCDVVLTLDGTHLVARATMGEHQRTMRTTYPGHSLVYLLDPVSGGVWLSEWPFELMVPRAVGVVGDIDTIILRMGLQ